MRRSTSSHARHAFPILAAFLATGVAAQSGGQWPALPILPWPGDSNYLGVLAGGCPASDLDPSNPPRARQIERIESPLGKPEEDRYLHEVRYWRVTPSQVCPLPPPTFLEYSIDLGPLPPGLHTLKVIRIDDGIEQPFSMVYREVREHPALPDDVTGAWYAPEQSGRGLFVALRGGLAGVWWSTHDAQGQPLWVLMTEAAAQPWYSASQISGEAITTTGTPLAPGPAELEAQRWGELRFSYRGCGRARLEWQADDPAIGEGQVDLVQLMLPDGIQPCRPTGSVNPVQAIWEE